MAALLVPEDAEQETPSRKAESLSIGALFRTYAPMVGTLGMAMLGNRNDADDLIQDVFMRAWRGIETLRDPDAVKSWVMGIAVRTARTRLRSRRLARIWFGTEPANFDQIGSHAAPPEDRVMLARLFGVLEKVPANSRMAWTLRYLHKERLEDVAALCGCALSTAKRRIDAAHRIIMEKMT